MRNNMRMMERDILRTDYTVEDMKKDIRANYSEIYEEIKQAEKELMEESPVDSFDDAEVKTLPRSSSRIIRQKTEGFTYQRDR
jgi:hypothetical protein